ncbi:hypothetical protein EVAR_96885_1 [Eumeta japonica]|uniref:Uncharacterized protein n=1 Tax=Eumeta variegata TaxID=151549 RepID=A0A4C1WFF0_EUMVA|nr:hypothetical protein EVAR_96885_1 [Eumeta japonica]
MQLAAILNSSRPSPARSSHGHPRIHLSRPQDNCWVFEGQTSLLATRDCDDHPYIPPIDTGNPKGVASALAASWLGVRCLMER